jgi:hypothetical protein
VSRLAMVSEHTPLRWRPALRQAALAALNENEQNDNKQNSGDGSNDCYVIHLVSFPDSEVDDSALGAIP